MNGIADELMLFADDSVHAGSCEPLGDEQPAWAAADDQDVGRIIRHEPRSL